MLSSQADSGGKGEHRDEGRGDWEPGQQRGPRRLTSSTLLAGGTGQRREGIHDSFHHLLHVGVSLTTQFWTFHPPSATFPCQGDRQTGTVMKLWYKPRIVKSCTASDPEVTNKITEYHNGSRLCDVICVILGRAFINCPTFFHPSE